VSVTATDRLLVKFDSELESLIATLVSATEKAMATQRWHWYRYRRKLRNSWYLNDPDTTGRPWYTTNYLRDVVTTAKAFLLVQLPQPTVSPVEDTDAAGASVLSLGLRHAMRQGGWQPAAWSAISDAIEVGVGWRKAYLDPEGREGRGQVRFGWVAAEDLLVDPYARFPEEARWFLHIRRRMDAEEIGKVFDAEVPVSSGEADEYQNLRADSVEESEQPGLVYDVVEAWIRDPRLATRWRVVLAALSGKGGARVIPFRGKRWRENPFAHGQAPFVPNWVDWDPRTMFPSGFIEAIEPLQDYADELDEIIQRILHQTARRAIVVNTAIAPALEILDNDPHGAIIEVAGDVRSAIMWDQPPIGVLTELIAIRDRLEHRIERVSGIVPVLRGQRETGIDTASGQALAHDAASRKLFLVREILAWADRDLAIQALSNVRQFYGPKWIIRTAENQRRVIVEAYPPDIAEAPEAQKAAWRVVNGVDVVLSDLTAVDVDVAADTALPATRRERADLYLKLYETKREPGLVDELTVLQELDVPNAEEINARIEARQAQGMEGAMNLAAGMPPGAAAQPAQAAVLPPPAPPIPHVAPGLATGG